MPTYIVSATAVLGIRLKVEASSEEGAEQKVQDCMDYYGAVELTDEMEVYFDKVVHQENTVDSVEKV